MTPESAIDAAESSASNDAAASPPADTDVDPQESGDEADAFAAMQRVDPVGAEQLRVEWGTDFEHKLEQARHTAALVADDALIAALEETGLGNDPRILRAAAKIGALLQQGPHAGAADGEREALERELDRLVSAPDYWSDRVQRRVRQIFLSLHGSRPLPVHRSAGDGGGL